MLRRLIARLSSHSRTESHKAVFMLQIHGFSEAVKVLYHLFIVSPPTS
jgi:hypothetical protein